MSFEIKKNVLHYYVDLLREKAWNETGGALHNVIRTMRFSRHDRICGDDFSKLDFGNIPLNGVYWSMKGEFPSSFEGSVLHEFNFRNGHSKYSIGKEISPDGKLLLTGSEDGSAILWDLETGLIVHELKLHLFGVIEVAFSKSGKLCLTVSRDSTAAIWDVESGAMLQHLKDTNGHTGDLEYGRFSPNEEYCLTCSIDTTSIVWNVKSGSIEFSVKGEHKRNITGIGFSWDGTHFFTQSPEESCVIWELKEKRKCFELAKVPHMFADPCYISEQDDIAMLCSDNTLTIFHGTDGSVAYEIPGIISFCVLPNARQYLAAKTADHKVLLINSQDGSVLKDFTMSEEKMVQNSLINAMSSAEITHNLKYLLTSHCNRIILWDIKSKEKLMDIPTSGCSTIVHFSKDDKYFYFVDSDINIFKWDIRNRQCVFAKSAKLPAITEVALSPNGKYGITITEHGIAYFWNIRCGKKTHELHRNANSTCAFSPDNRFCLIGTKKGTVILWQIKQGIPNFYREFNPNEDVTYVNFTPDSRYCLTFGRKLHYWNIKTGKSLLPYTQLSEIVDSCTFESNKKNMFVHNVVSSNPEEWANSWKYCQHLYRAFLFYSGGQYRMFESTLQDTCSVLIPYDKRKPQIKYYNHTYRRSYMSWLIETETYRKYKIYEEICACVDIEYDYAWDIAVSLHTTNKPTESLYIPAPSGIDIKSCAYSEKAGLLLIAFANGTAYLWDINNSTYVNTFYHIDLNIKQCDFRNIIADDNTRKILYQYGANIDLPNA